MANHELRKSGGQQEGLEQLFELDLSGNRSWGVERVPLFHRCVYSAFVQRAVHDDESNPAQKERESEEVE